MMKENFNKNIKKFHQIPFEKYLSICHDTVRNMNTIYEAMYRYTYTELEDGDEDSESDNIDNSNIGAYNILKVYLDIALSNISKLYSGNFENFDLISLSDFMSNNSIEKYPFNIYIRCNNIKYALVSCSDMDFLKYINSLPFKDNDDAKINFIKKIYGPIYNNDECNNKDIMTNDYILAVITSIIGYCSNYSGCCNAYFEDANFCQYSTAFALDCYEILYNPLFHPKDNSLVNRCITFTNSTYNEISKYRVIGKDENMFISSILSILYTTKFMYFFGMHYTEDDDDNQYNIPFFYSIRNYSPDSDFAKNVFPTMDIGQYTASSINRLIFERLIYFVNEFCGGMCKSHYISTREKIFIKKNIENMMEKSIKNSIDGGEKWEKMLSNDIKSVDEIYNDFVSSKSGSDNEISKLELSDDNMIASSLNDGKSVIKTNIRSNLPIDSLVSTLGDLVEHLSKNLKDKKLKDSFDNDDAPYIDSTTILKKCNIATISDILSSFFSTDKGDYDIDDIIKFLTLYKKSKLSYDNFHYYEIAKNKLEIEYMNNEHNNKLNFTINDKENRYVIISVTDQNYLENFDGMVDDMIKMFKYIKYELGIKTK